MNYRLNMNLNIIHMIPIMPFLLSRCAQDLSVNHDNCSNLSTVWQRRWVECVLLRDWKYLLSPFEVRLTSCLTFSVNIRLWSIVTRAAVSRP